MKKNLKNKVLFALIAMVITISTASISNAYSAGVSLSADKNLAANTEISITVSVNNLNVGKGIDAFMATIKYDKKVFEALKNDSVVATNGWSTMFNPSTNIFTLLNNSKISKDSAIATIKLKVKSNISDYYSTEVELVNVSASGGALIDGGTGDININNASLMISRTPYSSTDSNTNTKNNNNVTNTTNSKTQNTTNNSGENNSQIQPENMNNQVPLNNEGNNINEEYELSNDVDNQELHLLDENTPIQLINNKTKFSYAKIIVPIIGIVLVSSFIIGYIRYKKIKKDI
ncbi:hypothetical protein D3C72_1213100 [compost metagenome]